MHPQRIPDHLSCRSAQLCKGSLCRAGRAGSHLPSETVPHLLGSSDTVDTLALFHEGDSSCFHSSHLPTSSGLQQFQPKAKPCQQAFNLSGFDTTDLRCMQHNVLLYMSARTLLTDCA